VLITYLMSVLPVYKIVIPTPTSTPTSTPSSTLSTTWKKEYGPWTDFWNDREYNKCVAYREAIQDAYNNGYERIILLDQTDGISATFPTTIMPADEKHIISGPGYMIMHRRAFPAFLCFLHQPYGPINIYYSLYKDVFPCADEDSKKSAI
jgi:hypothetical protein